MSVDKLKEIISALAVQTKNMLAETGDTGSTTYSFYDADGQLVDTPLTEEMFSERAEKMGLLAVLDDPEAAGRIVHQVAIRFVRVILMQHEEIHYLTAHGEVWVTPIDIKTGEAEPRYEMMHYSGNSRDGAFVMATQSLIRPAGGKLEFGDDFAFGQAGTLRHGDVEADTYVGEMTTMFPVQRDPKEVERDWKLARIVRESVNEKQRKD